MAEILAFLDTVETIREKARLTGNYRSVIRDYEQGLSHLSVLLSSSSESRYHERLRDLQSKIQVELSIIYDLKKALNSFKNFPTIESVKPDDDDTTRDPDVWLAPSPITLSQGWRDDSKFPSSGQERRQPGHQKSPNNLPSWAKGKDNDFDNRPRTNQLPGQQLKPSDYANARESRRQPTAPHQEDAVTTLERIRKERDADVNPVNPCAAAVNASNQRDPQGQPARRKTATPVAQPSSSSRRTLGAAGAIPNKPPVPTRPPPKAPAVEGNPLSEYEDQIMNEMLDKSPDIRWDDIAGLSYAKQTLQEAVILPNLRPDLFVGLRRPPKGVLLFGPPGTGKTLLAKAVATESGFVFFSITSSSVMSKYLGEGEKLMRALFSLARKEQPSVIFFDEIDAMMSARKENEHEASRRLKTEFMTQVDGATTSAEDRILIMAATNIPWELDEAVLRRLVKRIYVPLPDEVARAGLIQHLMRKQGSGGGGIVEDVDNLNAVVKMTAGYSGSDLSAVCHEAAMGPIRELGPAALLSVKAEDVRALEEKDFTYAVQSIRPSVSPDSLLHYSQWAEQFGVTR